MEGLVVEVRLRMEKAGDGGESEGERMVEIKVRLGEDYITVEE